MSCFRSILFIVAFVSTTTAFAQDKPATDDKGSGKAVVSEKDGKKLGLSDILDKTVCQWRDTGPLLKEFKLKERVDAILANLKTLHPYMAYLIKREMDAQHWCLTTNLKFAVADDADQVTESYIPELQIAIREITPKKVFLDVPKFRNLIDDDHRAMTLIHETAHSFLDKASTERNAELRAVVRKIYDYYIDQTKNNTLFTPAEQIANMNSTLQATNSLNVFKSVEFGQAFGKAVTNPAALTEAQWSLLIGYANPVAIAKDSANGLIYPSRDDVFGMIINEVGQAKFAGGLMQHSVDFMGMKYYAQVATIRAVIAAADADNVTQDTNQDPFAEASRVTVGACAVTKAATSFSMGSGGFWSTRGWVANFSQEIALRDRDSSKLHIKSYFPATWTRNNSILIWARINKLSTVSETYIKQWEAKIQKVADYLNTGACNDASAAGRKYL